MVAPMVESPGSTAAPAQELLATASGLVEPALRQAVGELARPIREVANFHFGWQAPDGTPLPGGTGKMLRAALALYAAQAVGDRDLGLPGAVAVELIHNSSLLKDDVMDRDPIRRHRP